MQFIRLLYNINVRIYKKNGVAWWKGAWTLSWAFAQKIILPIKI
jgi:hypothetical protein